MTRGEFFAACLGSLLASKLKPAAPESLLSELYTVPAETARLVGIAPPLANKITWTNVPYGTHVYVNGIEVLTPPKGFLPAR